MPWFTPTLGLPGIALTLAMPLSNAFGWYWMGQEESLRWTYGWHLAPATFYWLWAWKNRCERIR